MRDGFFSSKLMNFDYIFELQAVSSDQVIKVPQPTSATLSFIENYQFWQLSIQCKNFFDCSISVCN